MTRGAVRGGVPDLIVIYEYRGLKVDQTIAPRFTKVKTCLNHGPGLTTRAACHNLACHMDVSQFTNAQVVILEGVPGAGKTLLQELLRVSIQGRAGSFFPEEALLFGWIHAWLPGIDELRMSLMHRMVDHIEHTLSSNPRSFFVLNRFHVSYLIFARTPDMEAYDALLARLRKLAVLVLVPQLCDATVADRALHVERADPLWRVHLNKRLADSGFRDLSSMYTAEQGKVRQILADQQLPYEILDGSALGRTFESAG
jgi:hypothetical protein